MIACESSLWSVECMWKLADIVDGSKMGNLNQESFEHPRKLKRNGGLVVGIL